MQPLKLIVPGEYWDSYVYAGRLFLFGARGNIRTLNWDALVRGLNVDSRARLALFCAFLRSDYLYGPEVQELLHDTEIREIVRSKFSVLEGQPIEVSRALLSKAEIGQQDNPCPFPHAEIELYYRNLYVGGPSGVVRATASGRTKYPISTRPQKIWDAPVFGMSASWSRLALAAGEEGLFETAVPTSRAREEWADLLEEPRPQFIDRTCQDCNWNFHSVFGSSLTGGFLADYQKEPIEGSRLQRRILAAIIPAEELFGRSGYSWGVQDKLCSASPEGIRVIRYTPWERDQDLRFEDLGTVRMAQWKGQVISASVAPFGMVVELERALVIFPSSGRTITFRGEPVNWRVFPRSKHYENQLHVVYDDRLEIHSFNQDYLVDQQQKRKGTAVRSSPPAGGHLFLDA